MRNKSVKSSQQSVGSATALTAVVSQHMHMCTLISGVGAFAVEDVGAVDMMQPAYQQVQHRLCVRVKDIRLGAMCCCQCT